MWNTLSVWQTVIIQKNSNQSYIDKEPELKNYQIFKLFKATPPLHASIAFTSFRRTFENINNPIKAFLKWLICSCSAFSVQCSMFISSPQCIIVCFRSYSFTRFFFSLVIKMKCFIWIYFLLFMFVLLHVHCCWFEFGAIICKLIFSLNNQSTIFWFSVSFLTCLRIFIGNYSIKTQFTIA